MGSGSAAHERSPISESVLKTGDDPGFQTVSGDVLKSNRSSSAYSRHEIEVRSESFCEAERSGTQTAGVVRRRVDMAR